MLPRRRDVIQSERVVRIRLKSYFNARASHGQSNDTTDSRLIGGTQSAFVRGVGSIVRQVRGISSWAITVITVSFTRFSGFCGCGVGLVLEIVGFFSADSFLLAGG